MTTPPKLNLNRPYFSYSKDTFVDYMGDSSLLNQSTRVSIIGSRKPTAIGKKVCETVTQFVVDKNWITVSGMADGIDTIVHKLTLSKHGKTIAVLGTPIDKIYPKSNTLLYQDIAKNGLIISQFPIGSNTRPSHFPMRNKTMANISNITIVCDASQKSGTKHQVYEALRLNRKVYIFDHILKDLDVVWAKEALMKGAISIDISNFKTLLDF